MLIPVFAKEVGMVERPTRGLTQISFVLRFWLEAAGARGKFWRGRIREADSDAGAYVQEGAGILRFIRGRLFARSGIDLPVGSIEKTER
jgi:hypothetical protein